MPANPNRKPRAKHRREKATAKPRFKPIEQVNLTDRVYRMLKERILSQEIEVGTRLRDEELATELHVSRTPVREALMHLSREGLVVVIPRSGTRVRTFTEKDIEEIFEIRGALERQAVRKAVDRLEPEETARLKELWETAARALQQGDIEPALELDQEMHQMILEASDNRKLQEIMVGINDYVALFRNLGARTPEHGSFTYLLPEIIEALQERNAEAAARCLSEHIEEAKEQTIRDFNKRQLLEPAAKR